MAKRFSSQRALEKILEEREGLEDDEKEELSEYEDHISINSGSNNEFEEEDENDHQPASKEPVSSQQQDQQIPPVFHKCDLTEDNDKLWPCILSTLLVIRIKQTSVSYFYKNCYGYIDLKPR